MKVLKIGASWCAGCLIMKPRWGEIEREYPWLKTEYYDFDTDKHIVEKYATHDNLPVFIFLNNKDEEILRLSGEVEKEKLIEIINAHKNQ